MQHCSYEVNSISLPLGSTQTLLLLQVKLISKQLLSEKLSLTQKVGVRVADSILLKHFVNEIRLEIFSIVKALVDEERHQSAKHHLGVVLMRKGSMLKVKQLLISLLPTFSQVLTAYFVSAHFSLHISQQHLSWHRASSINYINDLINLLSNLKVFSLFRSIL